MGSEINKQEGFKLTNAFQNQTNEIIKKKDEEDKHLLDVEIAAPIEKDTADLSSKIANEAVQAEKEAAMGAALEGTKLSGVDSLLAKIDGLITKQPEKIDAIETNKEPPAAWKSQSTANTTIGDMDRFRFDENISLDKYIVDPKIVVTDGKIDLEENFNTKIDKLKFLEKKEEAKNLGFKFTDTTVTTPYNVKFDLPSDYKEATKLLTNLINEYKASLNNNDNNNDDNVNNNNNNTTTVPTINTAGKSIQELLTALVDVFKSLLDKAETFINQIVSEAGKNSNTNSTENTNETDETNKALTAKDYQGINVGKNLYDEYGLKIISDNKNLTSENLQVANYSLNADGTINVNSLHSELKLVYNNLQKYVLEYYNSSEAGKAALKALGGADNLRKIVDAAWQNRAISQSWTNKEVNMQEFIKSVFGVYEEMIRSIEADPECLTRLINSGFETYNFNGEWNDISDLASKCAQIGKSAAENLKGGEDPTVNIDYYKFELTQDANGFKKPADKYISDKTGIYFPNDADVYTQYAFDTALSRLRTYLSKMFPWIDSDLLSEDLQWAEKLAMWGLANSTNGNTLTISLEKYIETVTEYFMAYVNQDYRNNSNAQNMDFTRTW